MIAEILFLDRNLEINTIMKNIYLVIITVLLGWAFHQLLPWWAIVVAGFVVGIMNDKKIGSIFGITFLGGALLWGGMSWWMNYQNEGILADKMASLFGTGSATAMVIITLVIGGIFAGLGGMSGRSIRRLIKK